MTSTGENPAQPQTPTPGGAGELPAHARKAAAAWAASAGGPGGAPAAAPGAAAETLPPDVTPEDTRKLEDLLDTIEGQEELEDSRIRFRNGYGLVLVLLVTTYFVTAISGDHTWGQTASLVLLAATTWTALRASHVERVLLRWAMALIPFVTVVAVVAVVLGSAETGRGVGAALTVLLVVFAPFAIARRLLSHIVVSFNTFYGAVCIYLLIAMWFAAVYSLSAWSQGGAFFVQVQPPAHAGTIDYLYFSFITMTTVGYGDLTAAGSVGRMTAACEAVLGQLYLITVVALVVQNLGQARHFRDVRKRLRGE